MRRRGFTLPELLIGAALGTLILGLALRGFSEIVRAVAVSRSRFEATQHANTGIARLSESLRRAHVFFYAARPLREQNTVISGRPGQHAQRDPLPAALLDSPNLGTTFRPPTTNAGHGNGTAWLAGAGVSKRRFRFTFGDDDPSGGGEVEYLLRVAPGKRTGDPLADRFPGPLAYFAVADFKRTKSNDETNPHALLPRSWTFHVLYVAPMNLQANDANFSSATDPRDHLPPPVRDNNFARTAVPHELRMLTIPDVAAGAPAAPANYTCTTADTSIPGHPVAYDSTVGRIIAPGVAAGGEPRFLDPPFDYDGMKDDGRANYDPVPIPMPGTGVPAASYAADTTTGLFRFLQPAGGRAARPPSGPRIRGAGLHSNFGMVGNDPPTAEALANRIPPLDPPGATVRPITDTLIMAYVDPDSVEGTSVRFVNNLAEPSTAADAAGRAQWASGARYHRFVETIGPECPYFENRVHGLLGPGGASTSVGALGMRPNRLLISAAVRYRSRRDIPFAFANVQSEIPLDGVDQFAKLRPLP